MTGTKKLRRRMATVLATGLGLALLGTTTAYANHAYVRGDVRVQHGGTQAAITYSPLVACSSTSCSVTVTLNKRDYNRVARWCGSAYVDVKIPAGQFSWTQACFGPSDWAVAFDATLFDSSQKTTTDTSDVTVRVNVTT
jgi:hypothetical protein